MKIDPHPFIIFDIKHNKKHACKIKHVGYKNIEENCRIKTIIFLADRLNWGIDHADFKQAVRAYKQGYPGGYEKALKIADIIRSFLKTHDYKNCEECLLEICDILEISLSYHITYIIPY
ncbi:MAG TPA: hypothetical protein PK800_04080 [Syntrophorhabdaceae bacterium]|nr:hypothetical protein [Syntrophorhabdaceae bacterium]